MALSDERANQILLPINRAIHHLRSGVAENLITPEEYKNLFRLDDWNEVMIVAKGTNMKHYMNGRLVLDFTDLEPNLSLIEGILALQLHAGKPMWVEFKSIELAKWGDR